LNSIFFALNHHEPRNVNINFLILGNPGLTAYYEDFIEMLHLEVKKPVWAVCHAGHEFEDEIPCPKGSFKLTWT